MTTLRSLFNSTKRIPCRLNTNTLPNEAITEQVPFEFNLSVIKKFPHLKNDLTHFSSLKCISFPRNPGLLLFPQILNSSACEKWFNYFIKVAPIDHANILKSNVSLPPHDPDRIRWLTFGYHYDWDDKCYYENKKDVIPKSIEQLIQCLAMLIGLPNWQVQTGIINYYTCKSRLGPHVDGFEKNIEYPLLSLSLGSNGIFVIEDKFNGDYASSILLKDGDLMVMSGESRLLTHALAKVFCRSDSESCSRRKVVRINVNARQYNDLPMICKKG